MPTPKKGERKKKFIKRCIPYLYDNEPDTLTSKDKKNRQAYAICNSIYDKDKKNENILSFKNFINENIKLSDKYIKELTEDDFNEILNKYCKNFDPNDEIIFRGDSRLDKNFYFLNTKKRKVKNLDNHDQYHLYFLDKWVNLPIKSKSSDFVISGKSSTYASIYGNLYRFIPFDNATFVTNHKKLVGNYNKKLEEDINISTFNLNSILHNIIINENKQNLSLSEKINFLNDYFDKKDIGSMKSMVFATELKLIKKILNKRNISLYDYLTEVFSPKYYNIKNYDKLISEGDDIFWTDSHGLMINYKFSKQFFNKPPERIEKEYTIDQLDDILNQLKNIKGNFGNHMKWIKTNYPFISRNNMIYLSNKLKKNENIF